MPVPTEAGSGAQSPLECAIVAIEAELGVVFASADRVEAACRAARSAAQGWTDPDDVARLARVLPLAQQRTGAASAAALALMLDAALGAPSWDLLAGLLESRDAGFCGQVLDGLGRLVSAGTFPVDARVAETLASLVDRSDSPLCRPDLLERIASLLRHVPHPGPGDGDVVALLYETSPSSAVRRLAGRVLDLQGAPPAPDTLRRILGDAADVLGPLLAYTRASHLDLAHLVPGPGQPPEILDQLAALDAACGNALAAEIVGELGWRRTNLALSFRVCTGVSADDSVPLIVDASEAGVALSYPGTRRVFDRVLVFGHGGSRGEGAASAGTDDVIARFRAYNLDHAEVLAEILDIAPLSVEKVASILDRMDRITREFVYLFASRSDECAVLPELYARLRGQIVAEMEAAGAGGPLSIELTRLVQMFEDPPSLDKVQTLHGLKRYLHQKGLALGFGLLESRHGTNRTLDVVLASPERVIGVFRCLEYVDFDPAPARTGPAPVPYPVAIVAEAFARQALHDCTSLPRVRVFCYGNEVHYFVYFRNHPLFVRMDLSPPLGGGMIDLAYYGVSKFELDEHPGLALEAVQAFFRRLDFDVKVENTRIVARYDKERARDLADLCERAEALFRLVPYLMDLDWTVGSLALPDEARRAVGVAWAEFFDQWGIPPAQYALTEDRTGILLAREPRPEGASEVRWGGQGAYSDITTGKPRSGFFTSLRDALATCGLEAPLVEPRKGAGQMSLEAHLLRPLRAALARGELVAGPDGWRRAPPELFRRQHEADRFAEILASDPAVIARAARLAGLAAALERTLRFETTGSVNGFDVQRAELVLRDQRLALYALRDGSGVFRLAVFAPGGAICLRRTDVTRPWTDNASGDVGELTPLLRRSNFLPSWIDAQPVAGSGDAEEVRAIFRSPNPRARESSLPGERALTAERAAPGRAVGPARLGTRRRHPDDLDGAVLFSASLKPEDSVFLYRAAAVVATGGGALSHAGLLAVQFGRPALIAPGTWREEPDGSVLLVCRRREFGERRRTVCGFAVVERCDVRDYDERIREGDLVVVDADEGVLTVLGQSNPALALHDGLRQLVAATRRLERATSATEVLADRGRRLHALHQLERLACRMEDPALTQHAVRELLTGTAAAEGLHGETSRLLGLLRGRAETRGLVETCIERIARDVAERHAAARDRALRLLPSSRYAFEALALRIDVVRVRQALEQAREVLRAASVPQPGDPDIAVEELAGARLGAILDTLLDRLRQPVALAVSVTARHELREAERIADVIGAPEDVAAQLRSRRTQCAQRDAELARALEGRPVLWPEDGGLEIEPLAGAKAANLAELQRLGAGPFVPSWFVVTDHAFREALKGTVPRRGGGAAGGGEHVVALGQAIDEVLARSDLDAEEKSAAIRRLWDNVYLPNAVSRAVTDAYRRLSESGTTPGAVRDAGIPGADASLETGDPFVAVRSSAREEDTEVSTGAGQFDTFLYVRGASDVLEYLKRGWSGLWTPRAIHSRAAGATSERGRGGGVIVQRMAWSRVSGVLQTVNAAERRTREMVINVGLGLGEGVVSGLVAADRVVVSKDQDPNREALRFHYVTADKRERVVFNAHRGTGTIRTGILSHQRLRAALEYVELVELVRAATRLEAAYRYPLDIEFGFEAAQLRIMQVRPVPGALAVWEQTQERYPIRCRVSSKT